MSTPITIKRSKLRASNPIPKQNGNSGCNVAGSPPDTYILQTFGVMVSEVDNFDSLTGLYGSEVMQGLQNFEDSDTFRASAYVRISYNGTDYKTTDGDMVFKGAEEHSEKFVEEDDPTDGLLTWLN
jgi:hypothetical protein